MRALILNGGPSRCGDTVDALQRTFTQELTENGWDVDPIVLRDLAIAYCQGEFDCCIATPGICKINDAARDVARAYIQSDLVILLTPVTFGGYSAELKKAVDRFAFPLLSPPFTRVHGETHHPRRYRRYPRLVAVGVQPHADAQSERIFRFLVARNALTMHAPAHAVGVITPQMEEYDIQAEVRRVLGAVNAVPDPARNGSVPEPRPRQPVIAADLPLTPAPDSLAQAAPPQRALLLVGSARQMPSMSNSLGS